MSIKEDVLNYMCPSIAFNQEFYLQSPNNPHYFYIDPINRRLWYMKGAKGWPWDMNYFDDLYVYQCITEQSWTDPKQFKIMASSNWKGGGFPFAPRYTVVGDPDVTMDIPDSRFRIYDKGDCQTFTPSGGGKPAKTIFKSPRIIDFKGDLGPLGACITDYYWGSGNKETFYWALNRGWVKWVLSKWNFVTSRYDPVKTSDFNVVVPGKPVSVYFPCPIPVIP